MIRALPTLSSVVILISSAVAARADYVSSVLSDNPIGYWRLGEKSGLTAFDRGANGLDGQYKGNVSLGLPGALLSDADTAVGFDGVTGYVDVGARPDLNQLSNQFTIEAWIRGIHGTVVSTWQIQTPSVQASGYQLNLQQNSVLRFTTFGIKDYDLPVNHDFSDWTYVAAVLDAGNDVTFYVNGDVVGSVAGSLPARTNSLPFLIGRTPTLPVTGFDYFDGAIDEVAVYGTPLTPGKIREHYLAAAAPEPSSFLLVAFGAIPLILVNKLR